jgi:hypothetical protein
VLNCLYVDYEAKLLIGKEAMEQAKVQELQIAKATGELDQRRVQLFIILFHSNSDSSF